MYRTHGGGFVAFTIVPLSPVGTATDRPSRALQRISSAVSRRCNSGLDHILSQPSGYIQMKGSSLFLKPLSDVDCAEQAPGRFAANDVILTARRKKHVEGKWDVHKNMQMVKGRC